MTQFELMAQAIDFIEDNLQNAITVTDMAEAVSYSVYHFCRTFNQATHHTPYDYLMRRRLAESARALLHGNRKIIEIALDYQFNSPETFSRAFKRAFGVQPNQQRSQGRVDRRQLMPRLTLAHLSHLHQANHVKPVLAAKGAIELTGVMTLIKDDPLAIMELWDLLGQELGQQLVQAGSYYGLIYYPENWQEHGRLYMAAVETKNVKTTGAAMVTKTIPTSHYARFVHKGLIQDLPLTMDYVYHTWQPRSGQRISYSWAIEHSMRDFRDATEPGFEREIYIPLEA